MEQVFIDEENFNKINYNKKPLPKGVYEYCTFTDCNFSNSDLSDTNFLECEFINCDLSLVKINNTTFKEIVFKDCKLLGLHFEDSNKLTFTVNFNNCTLNHSTFYQVSAKKTKFKDSKLNEVDFTESDLSSSVFENCDLTGAIFENTNLEGADLRTSINFSINPDVNKIKKAKFSLAGLTGLLDKYDIEVEI